MTGSLTVLEWVVVCRVRIFKLGQDSYKGYNTGPYSQGNQSGDNRLQLDKEGKFIVKSSVVWIRIEPILQPCQATRTCLSIPLYALSMIFASNSMAAVTSRRTLKNATPSCFHVG